VTAGILVARAALDVVLAAGKQALPIETGGVLLGFRVPEGVVVTRALVVPDPRSSRHSYLLHSRRAQALMRAVRGDAPPVVGYVGEWHTHPAETPPSRTDQRALGAAARLAAGAVAQLVPAFPPAGAARLYGLLAERHPWPVPVISPVDIVPVAITVTDDTPDSLEAEATALTERNLH
jgi:integrative and conjugative element protein (TIGR02256 family)